MASAVSRHGNQWRTRWRHQDGEMQTFSHPDKHMVERFKTWLDTSVAERDVRQDDERIERRAYLSGAAEVDFLTLRKLAEEMMREREMDTAKPLKGKSISSYEDRIKRFGPLADMPYTAITKEMVVEHVHALRTEKRELTSRPYAANTVRETVSFMRQIGQWAVRKGRADRDPFIDVGLPPGTPKREDKFLAPETYAALRTFAPSEMFRDMMDVMALVTGARVGEVLALRVNDLGKEGGYHTLRIDETLNDLNAYGTTKTNRPRRLDIDPDAAAVLHRYAGNRAPEEALFAHLNGGPIPYGSFSSTWDRMILHALKAGMPFPNGVPTIHWLRHTYAAWFLAAKDGDTYVGDIYDLQFRLGHSSIQITIDRYGHKVAQARERALRATRAVRQQALQYAPDRRLRAVAN